MTSSLGGNGQLDDGKLRLTEDDIARAELGPRGATPRRPPPTRPPSPTRPPCASASMRNAARSISGLRCTPA